MLLAMKLNYYKTLI